MKPEFKSIGVMTVFLTTTLLSLMACGDLDPKSKSISSLPRVNQQETSDHRGRDADDTLQSSEAEDSMGVDVGLPTGPALSAGSLEWMEDLFDEYKWYSYNILNHRVYPLFDIYGIRSHTGDYYKVQIIDYYSKVNLQQSGFYELRVQRPDGSVKKIPVSAVGCGDPIGGQTPECEEQDIYAFLDLDSENIRFMTPDEAVKHADWDLGFQRTTVLLNTSALGHGKTLGALIYRNKNFFNALGLPRYSELNNAYVSGGEEEAFHHVGRLVP